MREETMYEFDTSAIDTPEAQAAREAETQTAFITNLKNAQLGYLLKEIQNELLNENHDLLVANDFLEDFSNFLVIAPADEKISVITDTTGEKAPIYIDEADELKPVFDTIMDNIDSRSKATILSVLEPYQELLERHGLGDIVTGGKYEFGNVPKRYTLLINSPENETKITKSVDYTNAEVFDVVNQYHTRLKSDAVVKANQQIEQFVSSDEFVEIYNYIKKSFDEALEKKVLSSDQLAKADELFAKIPHYDSLVNTAENEFCFDALKQAYQQYQLEPKLGKVWLQLPNQIQKDPEDLKNAISNGVVKDSGSKKIKSKVKNVEKMEAKANEVIKDSDVENLSDALKNLDEEQQKEVIAELKSKSSKKTGSTFLERWKKRKEVTGGFILTKLGKGCFYFGYELFKMSGRGYKLIKNMGPKIKISEITGNKEDEKYKISKKRAKKILSKEAKELKVTKDAAEKLEENNLENINSDILQLENKYDVLLNDESKTSEDKEQQDIVIDEIKSQEESVLTQETNTTEMVSDDLESKSKEELIAMIRNGQFSAQNTTQKKEEEKTSDDRTAIYDKYADVHEKWAGKNNVGLFDIATDPNYIKEVEEKNKKLAEEKEKMAEESKLEQMKRDEFVTKTKINALNNKVKSNVILGNLDADQISGLSQYIDDMVKPDDNLETQYQEEEETKTR